MLLPEPIWIYNEVVWYLHESSFTGSAWDINLSNENGTLKLQPHFPGANELILAMFYQDFTVLPGSLI